MSTWLEETFSQCSSFSLLPFNHKVTRFLQGHCACSLGTSLVHVERSSLTPHSIRHEDTPRPSTPDLLDLWQKLVYMLCLEKSVHKMKHLSHRELYRGKHTKEHQAEEKEVISWACVDLQTSFVLIRWAPPDAPSQQNQLITAGHSCLCVLTVLVCLYVQSCRAYNCTYVFESWTPERHKRLMFCQESAGGIVRDCVPQSCDQACASVCMCTYIMRT